MKFLPLLLLLASCASAPDADSPRRVSLRLSAPAGFDDRHRSALERITGGRARTIPEMAKEALSEELEARGVEVVEGDGEAILEATLGAWDLDRISSGGNATVDLALALRKPDGGTSWSVRIGPRTVSLRPGEARDPGALVKRIVNEAMRGYP